MKSINIDTYYVKERKERKRKRKKRKERKERKERKRKYKNTETRVFLYTEGE